MIEYCRDEEMRRKLQVQELCVEEEGDEKPPRIIEWPFAFSTSTHPHSSEKGDDEEEQSERRRRHLWGTEVSVADFSIVKNVPRFSLCSSTSPLTSEKDPSPVIDTDTLPHINR